VPESGRRGRQVPEQSPPDLLRHLAATVSSAGRMTAALPVYWLTTPTTSAAASRRTPGQSQSCHHLVENLLGGEFVPVGAARVLADGGDQLAELVVASDPELNPAGAAADMSG
jgi:hypothetical protein